MFSSISSRSIHPFIPLCLIRKKTAQSFLFLYHQPGSTILDFVFLRSRQRIHPVVSCPCKLLYSLHTKDVIASPLSRMIGTGQYFLETSALCVRFCPFFFFFHQQLLHQQEHDSVMSRGNSSLQLEPRWTDHKHQCS